MDLGKSKSNIIGFTENLQDGYMRPVNYLRIAVSEHFTPLHDSVFNRNKKSESTTLLSNEEISGLIRIFAGLGVEKIRFTGGEPFERHNFLSLLEETSNTPNIKSVNITTNGRLLDKYQKDLEKLNIGSININLDTLEEKKYKQLTGKNYLDRVLCNISNFAFSDIKIKINCEIKRGVNHREIAEIAHFAKIYPVDVRFIEEWPDSGNKYQDIMTEREIKERLKKLFPQIRYAGEHTHNSVMFKIDGFKGNIGVIGTHSRGFCTYCNKLGLSAEGGLKLCLFDGNVVNLGYLLKSGYDERKIKNIISNKVLHKHFDGFQAEESYNLVKNCKLISVK